MQYAYMCKVRAKFPGLETLEAPVAKNKNLLPMNIKFKISFLKLCKHGYAHMVFKTN